MRILFTQFTPPFEHGKSELGYLCYDDWFAKLRRHFAAKDEVVFLSQTKQKEMVSIERDGYLSLFFPVDNPKERQREGRLWYVSTGMEQWVDGFKPDVIHIIGAGTAMAGRILQQNQSVLSFLWERCTVTDGTLNSPEVRFCDYYVLPTEWAMQQALRVLPRQRLLLTPLGSDTVAFCPLREVPKRFHIVSAGRLTADKQYGFLRDVVVKRNLSWIHAGGLLKGPPYRKWQDLLYSRQIRRMGWVLSPKTSPDGRWVSDLFAHDKMPWVYNQAHVMVHPSSGEGAARAVQESLACGVPVVALKHVVPWLQADHGVVLDSLSQLDEAVMSLVENPVKASVMGLQGRQWLLNHHSFDKMAQAVSVFHGLPKANAIDRL
ncbi:MAG: glycosyltransferase [Magnetococcus sp. YQC-5]